MANRGRHTAKSNRRLRHDEHCASCGTYTGGGLCVMCEDVMCVNVLRDRDAMLGRAR